MNYTKAGKCSLAWLYIIVNWYWDRQSLIITSNDYNYGVVLTQSRYSYNFKCCIVSPE